MKRKAYNSKDYSVEDLPSNRIEVFLDVLRNRWKTLLGIGLLLLLFMIPLLTGQIIEDILSIQHIGMYQDARIEQQLLFKNLQTTFSLMGIVKTLMLMILSVGIAGCVRIIKRLIWAEGIEFFHDFSLGVRENWKKMLLLFLLLGLLSTLVKIAPYALSQSTDLSELSYTALRSIITSGSIVLLMPIGAFVFSQIIFYENRFFVMCINSVAFCGKTILSTYFLLVLFYVPCVIVNHFCNISTQIIIYSFATVILLPLVLMIWLLYSCYVFDKYVNATFYPEIVDKGIWRKESLNKSM